MLPVKAGTQRLSEEAKVKLDLFYRQFCEGENRARYGLGHIVFAAHASFPLLLSPELANLIWLNFNSYKSAAVLTQQKIDPVTVSDFLLSPLVRPVANRQYEVIPEIRSYFLYLLKDSRWFNLFGIQSFGDTRLSELAHFMLLYLQDKKAQQENDVTGFHQLNRWSALAYLDPDLLAKEMATSLKDMLPISAAAPEDQRGQLRIYMLADRLGKQIDLNIHSKQADSARLFLNFQKYSNANMQRLLGNDEVDFYENYDQLEGDFISTRGASDTAVLLPLKKGIGSRLYRNKNNIQRIFPVIIGIDTYSTGIDGGLDLGHHAAAAAIPGLLDQQARNGEIDFSGYTTLFDEQATPKAIQDAIEMAFLLANDEDIVLIFFSGDIKNIRFFSSFFKEKRRNRCQVILMLNTEDPGDAQFVDDSDIQILLPQRSYDTFRVILDRIEKKVTYRDLFRLMQNSISEIRVKFKLPSDEWNSHFLRRKSRGSTDDELLMVHNSETQRWNVCEDDFNPAVIGAKAMARSLTGEQVPDNMGGTIAADETSVFLEGGDENLTEQYIYKLRIDKGPLLFNTTVETPKVAVLPYSKWSSFLYSTDPAPLRIEHHPDADPSYNIAYYDNPSSQPVQWFASDAGELSTSLTKFNRWFYLKTLGLPKGYTPYHPPFEILVYCYWVDPLVDSPRSENDSAELKINEHSILIDNGKIAFRDLRINLISFENQKVYFHPYLVLSDFTILPLTSEPVPIDTKGPVGITIPHEKIPMKILSEGLEVTLKCLFSVDPIITDFSQTGIL